MGPIAKEWARFSDMCVPEKASEVQQSETRKAFYAGCASMFGTMIRELKAVPDGPDEIDQGYKKLDEMKAELLAFSLEVLMEKA